MKNAELNSQELPFLKFGNGKKAILAFHGFGQDAGYYQALGESFGKEYTIYSFFLPYHGDYLWKISETPVSTSVLTKYIDLILEKFEIDKFILIGYSIGAKIVLALSLHYQKQLLKLILIAPDGIAGNFWYHFSTSTYLTRKIFKYGIRHQKILLSVADLLSKMKMVHPATLRFAKSQLGDEAQIEKVYYTWLALRNLNTPWKEVVRVIKLYKIPTLLILGDRDKIISAGRLNPYIGNIPELDIHKLNSGHTHLIEEAGKYLKKEDLL